MTSQLKIYYSGFDDKGTGTATEKKTRDIMARSVSLSGTKNLSKAPNANLTEHVEVQTRSKENLQISVSGMRLIDIDTKLSWADVLKLYNMNYNGSNAPQLTIIYDDDKTVTGGENTTPIKVILESFDLLVDPNAVMSANKPVINLQFIETK